MQPSPTHWFRNTVLYQIYPRSFLDTTGDGVGDLRGITQRLRYLNGDDDSLGVGAIWLSPFYPSPMADFGYDVSDHCSVDPLFGDLDDFKRLLLEAHQRGMKVVIDFIPNHTSDQHAWFKESRQSKDGVRRNWYVWHDPAPDGGPPNNWQSVFGGSAWEYDKASNQYYLHSFLKEQPDLNWENAGVRAAMQQVLRFWLDLGVDGFRVDAVYWISKDTQFRDDPPNKAIMAAQNNPYDKLRHVHSKQGPKLFRYLKELTDVLHAYTDTFMIVEASPDVSEINDSYMDLYEFVDATVCAPFNFEGIFTPWKASAFQNFIDRFQAGMHPSYVPVYCMGNHDEPRLASRLSPATARAAAVMQLALPGLPIVYYGDELGMTNGDISPEAVQDTFELQVPGRGLGRDPERTPMQWSAAPNAGFTKAPKPWLPVNPNYSRLNVDSQQTDTTSSLNLYRQAIALRAKSEALRHGAYQSVAVHENVFCFERRLASETMLAVINFEASELHLEHELLNGAVELSSHTDANDDNVVKPLKGKLQLRANEAVIIRVSQGA